MDYNSVSIQEKTLLNITISKIVLVTDKYDSHFERYLSLQASLSSHTPPPTTPASPHPPTLEFLNLVSFGDLLIFTDPPLVFLELVSYGDLLGYLRKSRGEDDDYYISKNLKSPKGPTPQHLFSFAHDVAKGMAFLAENKVPAKY
jgi:hypothetical protein